MTCKDCIHYAVCKEHEKIMLTVNNLYELIYQSGVEVSCKHFSTADVVSKSEVEELEKEVERLTAILNSYALQYGTVVDKQKVIDKANAEVARGIFKEIDLIFRNYYAKCSENKELKLLEPLCQAERFVINEMWHEVAELKKKYLGEPSSTPNNTCICCGEIIPEGRQVCPACEKQLKNYKPKGVKTKTVGKYVAPDLGVQLTIDDMENNND